MTYDLTERIRKDVKVLAKECEKKEEFAFTQWICATLFGLEESEAEDATDLPPTKDLGVDAWHLDSAQKVLLLVQSKYSSEGLVTSPRGDVTDLAGLPLRLLNFTPEHEPPTDREAKLQELSSVLREALDGGYAIKLILVVLGNLSVDAKKEVPIANVTLLRTLGNQNISLEVKSLADIHHVMHFGETQTLNLEIVEGHLYSRTGPEALVLTIKGSELANAYALQGDALFGLNPRLMLNSAINKEMRKSLKTDKGSRLFWYYNNGVSCLCNNYTIDATRRRVRVDGMRVVNGCQTTKALYESMRAGQLPDCVEVMMRIVKKDPELKTLEFDISRFTNRQNAIQDRDLASRRPEQLELKDILNSANPKIFLRIRRGEKPPKNEGYVADLENLDAARCAIAMQLGMPAASLSVAQEDIFDEEKDWYQKLFKRENAYGLAMAGLCGQALSKHIKELRKLPETNALRVELLPYLGLKIFRQHVIGILGELLVEKYGDLRSAWDALGGTLLDSIQTLVRRVALEVERAVSMLRVMEATKEKSNMKLRDYLFDKPLNTISQFRRNTVTAQVKDGKDPAIAALPSKVPSKGPGRASRVAKVFKVRTKKAKPGKVRR